MATSPGKFASVKIGTYTVAEQGTWKMNGSSAEIDVTSFGSAWAKSQTGPKKWSISFNGWYDATDTNGQNVLSSAWLNDTLITTLKAYMDSTSYWTPDVTADSGAGCRVTAYEVGNEKAGVGTVSFTVSGSGPITWL